MRFEFKVNECVSYVYVPETLQTFEGIREHEYVDGKCVSNYRDVIYNTFRSMFVAANYVPAHAWLSIIRRVDNSPWSWFEDTRKALGKHRSTYELRPTHPAVRHVLERLLTKPRNPHLLALENPTIAEDGERVAYTRNEHNRERGVNTATSIGKYLRRHFDLPDHVIRDLTGLYCADTFEIWDTSEGIVRSVQEGPHSCMKWRGQHSVHPYEAYDPAFGWKVAVRLKGKDRIIVGRALINDGMYVRSYLAANDDPESTDYSHSDNALEAWLEEQGIVHAAGWEGYKLAKVGSGDWVVPYLDGDCDRFDDNGDYLYIDSDGEYVADCSDGSYTGADRKSCECCGDVIDEDDTYFVETPNISLEWCGNCADLHSTHAHGPDGEARYSDRHYDFLYCDLRAEYYVNEPEILSRFDLVEINGEANDIEDVMYVPEEDIYVLLEDVALEGDTRSAFERCVYAEINGQAFDKEACVWCEYSDAHIFSVEAQELTNGDYVHKDYVSNYLEDENPEEIRRLLGDALGEYFPELEEEYV